MSDNDDNSRGRSLNRYLLGGLAIVISLWISVGWILPVCALSKADRGTFGDQFGAVNAMFSGLALAGVVAALLLQQEELRAVVKEQTEAAKQHSEIVRTQIVLQLMDDVRAQSWGDAHAALTTWRDAHLEKAVEMFLQDRANNPADSRIDQHRRTFIEPFYKLWALRPSDDVARQIVGDTAVRTFFEMVEPMERAISKAIEREKQWQSEREPLFAYFEHLYPGSRVHGVAPPSAPRTSPSAER